MTLCIGVQVWDAYDCIDTKLHVIDPINLGIKVPVGDLDLWLNGGTQSSNCNRHNYFGDMVCSHVESKLLFGATMRKNCHIARLNSRIRNRHNFFLRPIYIFQKVLSDSVNHADSRDKKVFVRFSGNTILKFFTNF